MNDRNNDYMNQICIYIQSERSLRLNLEHRVLTLHFVSGGASE